MPGLMKLVDYEDVGRNEGAEHKSGNRDVGRAWAMESQVEHRGQTEAGRQVDQVHPSPSQ